MSGVPEVDAGIRRVVHAIFRSQGMLREYFTDLFPYMREAVNKFKVENIWDTVYADVVTADYEIDRLALFLNKLYSEDRTLFASFLSYVTKEVLERFHEPKENLNWFFEELKKIGFEWNGKSLVKLDDR